MKCACWDRVGCAFLEKDLKRQEVRVIDRRGACADASPTAGPGSRGPNPPLRLLLRAGSFWSRRASQDGESRTCGAETKGAATGSNRVDPRQRPGRCIALRHQMQAATAVSAVQEALMSALDCEQCCWCSVARVRSRAPRCERRVVGAVWLAHCCERTASASAQRTPGASYRRDRGRVGLIPVARRTPLVELHSAPPHQSAPSQRTTDTRLDYTALQPLLSLAAQQHQQHCRHLNGSTVAINRSTAAIKNSNTATNSTYGRISRQEQPGQAQTWAGLGFGSSRRRLMMEGRKKAPTARFEKSECRWFSRYLRPQRQSPKG